MIRTLSALLLAAALPAFAADSSFLQFKNIYEPSGAVQLPDGRILTVEDESSRAFSLLTFRNGILQEDEAADTELLNSFTQEISDLEAATIDTQGRIYAITSHSETKQNERLPERERFIRFKIDRNRAVQTAYAPNLKDALQQNTALQQRILAQSGRHIDFNQANIEGLHYDTASKRLLLAFRDPLPLVLWLDNPDEVFDRQATPKFGGSTVFKWHGGGIRSLTYDPVLKTYLLANEISGANGKGQSQLWTWNGQADSTPQPLNLPEAAKLKNIEAIESVRLGGKPYLLLMGDNGSVKKQRGAHYLLLDYRKLQP